MRKSAFASLIILTLLSQIGAAKELYPLGRAEGSTWSQVAQAEKHDRLSVAALSTDGGMQMIFTFETIALDPTLFLGIFDAPAKSCGQGNGKTMTLSIPDPSRLMKVNGQEFPSSENCLEGHTKYSFKGVDASHDITEALLNAETVTLSIPAGSGRKEYTWKALAEERVREYEEGDRYKAYVGYTR